MQRLWLALGFLRKSIFIHLYARLIYSLSRKSNNPHAALTFACTHLLWCCTMATKLALSVIIIACFHASKRVRFSLKFNYCHLLSSSPQSCFFISTTPLPFQGNLLSRHGWRLSPSGGSIESCPTPSDWSISRRTDSKAHWHLRPQTTH